MSHHPKRQSSNSLLSLIPSQFRLEKPQKLWRRKNQMMCPLHQRRVSSRNPSRERRKAKRRSLTMCHHPQRRLFPKRKWSPSPLKRRRSQKRRNPMMCHHPPRRQLPRSFPNHKWKPPWRRLQFNKSRKRNQRRKTSPHQRRVLNQ